MVYFPATVKERQKSFRKMDYFLEFGTHGPRNYIGAKTIKTQESITKELSKDGLFSRIWYSWTQKLHRSQNNQNSGIHY